MRTRLPLAALTLAALVWLPAGCERPEPPANWIAPADSAGVQCVRRCEAERADAQPHCEAARTSCLDAERRHAEATHDAYATMRRDANRPIERMALDFARPERCNGVYRACMQPVEEEHRLCFEECGGRIETQ